MHTFHLTPEKKDRFSDELLTMFELNGMTVFFSWWNTCHLVVVFISKKKKKKDKILQP